MYLPHFCLSFRVVLFPCGKGLWLSRIILLAHLPNRSPGLCRLQHPQQNSPGHIACVCHCHECCLSTNQEGKLYKCLSCHRELSPRREHPGTAVTAHLQGAWFSAPNHCFTRLQCSHSCATHFYLCWLPQTLHIPMHRVSGAPGWLQGGEPQPPPAKSCTPAKQSPGQLCTLDHDCKATACAVFSLGQLLTHVWYSPSSASCEICTLKKLV